MLSRVLDDIEFIASLDASSAKQNGIVQILGGSIAIIFTIAAKAVNDDLSFGSVAFTLGGIRSLLASAKRDLRWTTAALISAVANVGFSIFVFSKSVVSIYDIVWLISNRAVYRTTMVFLSLVVWEAYAQLSTAVWAVYITSKALCFSNENEADDEETFIPHRSVVLFTQLFTSLRAVFISLKTLCYRNQNGSVDDQPLILQPDSHPIQPHVYMMRGKRALKLALGMAGLGSTVADMIILIKDHRRRARAFRTFN